MVLTDDGKYLLLRTPRGLSLRDAQNLDLVVETPVDEGLVSFSQISRKRNIYEFLTVDREGVVKILSVGLRRFDNRSRAWDYRVTLLRRIPHLFFYQLHAFKTEVAQPVPIGVFLGVPSKEFRWSAEGRELVPIPAPFLGVVGKSASGETWFTWTRLDPLELEPVALAVSATEKLIFVATGSGGLILVMSLRANDEQFHPFELSRWGYDSTRLGWFPFAPTQIRVTEMSRMLWASSYNTLFSFTFEGRPKHVIPVTTEDDAIGDFSVSGDGRTIWATCTNTDRLALISFRKDRPRVQYAERINRPLLVEATKQTAYVLDDSGRELWTVKSFRRRRT